MKCGDMAVIGHLGAWRSIDTLQHKRRGPRLHGSLHHALVTLPALLVAFAIAAVVESLIATYDATRKRSLASVRLHMAYNVASLGFTPTSSSAKTHA